MLVVNYSGRPRVEEHGTMACLALEMCVDETSTDATNRHDDETATQNTISATTTKKVERGGEQPSAALD